MPSPPSDRVTAHFRRAFGGGPTVVAAAPGRVNLIGEHTDYNDGLVLPIAIDAWCAVAASPSGDDAMRIEAVDVSQRCELPAPRAPGGTPPDLGLGPRPSWSRYVAGVLELVAATSPRPLPSLNMAFGSSVPIGGGLSSSAALEVSVALAALRAWGLDPPGPLDLARLCQRAEHEYAGVPCGLMDQGVSLLARAGHAMLLDCRTLGIEHVASPDAVEVVVIDTGVRHALASGEYAGRRDDCGRACRALGVGSLRDATAGAVEALTDPLLRRRARHVVSEIRRVREAAAALCVGRGADAGRLMLASHASLRDDYQVSCPELDRAVEGLMRMAGVLGARLTGGGFGGCVVALVERGAGDGVARRAAAEGLGASARVVQAVDGAWRAAGVAAQPGA